MGASDSPAMKKAKADAKFLPNKIATAENAAKADAAPPLFQLLDAMHAGVKNPAKGDCVVYWMRLEDMRSKCRYIWGNLPREVRVVNW